MKSKIFPSLIKPVLIMLVFVLFSSMQSQAFPYAKKTLRLFNKAEKLYARGKTEKALWTYREIISKENHGRSFKRIGDIELMRGDTVAARDILGSSIETLNAELLAMENDGQPDSELEELRSWIMATEEILSAIEPKSKDSGLLKMQVDHIMKETEFTTTIEDDKDEEFIADNSITVDIRSGVSSIEIYGLDQPVQIYNNGEVTTYYKYNEGALEGWNIPDFETLKSILKVLFGNNNKDSFLSFLRWDDQGSVVFLSVSYYYDEDNTLRYTGYKFSKTSDEPQKVGVDPGDLTSILLVKSN